MRQEKGKFTDERKLFGSRLTQLRKAAGYTQVVVAEKLGMDYKAYAAYEKGRNTPTYDKLLSLCEVFNTDPNFLMGYEDLSRFNTFCHHYGIEYTREKKEYVKVKFTLRPDDEYQSMTVEKNLFYETLNNLIDEFDNINNDFDPDVKNLRINENKYFQMILQTRIGLAQLGGLDWLGESFTSLLKKAAQKYDEMTHNIKIVDDMEKMEKQGYNRDQIMDILSRDNKK